MNHDESNVVAGDTDRTDKIQSLRDMIADAERTMRNAKAMLLQLEGKKRAGRPRKIEEIEDGTVVQGAFDGQVMQGSDGRQYPVPANYASKSKLIEGDVLKLTITPDGSFIYKQIGPAERRRAIGVVAQDDRGNYLVVADGRPYRVLFASITYFHIEPGDEVTIVCPRDEQSSWAAIENVLRKGSVRPASSATPLPTTFDSPSQPKDILKEWEEDFKDFGEPSPSTFENDVSSESPAGDIEPIK